MLTLTDHDRSQATWAGQPDRLGLADGTTVYVAARAPDRAVVVLDGDLSEPAMRGLMDAVWRESLRPKCRIIFLVFNTLRGEIDLLDFYCNTTFGPLPNRISTIAYLATCCGAGLYVASRCSLVVASPTAIIGHTECWSPASALDETGTAAMKAHLAHELPDVHPRSWNRLVGHAISGEEAEARGIVGGLRRTVWELCGLEEGESVDA